MPWINVLLFVLRNRHARNAVIGIVAGLVAVLALVILIFIGALGSMFSLCQERASELSPVGYPGGVSGGSEASPEYASSEPSDAALSDIPAEYLDAYEEAGEEYGMDWAFLAAVGKQETNHGQDIDGCATSEDGAQGPMQFIPSTWASEGVDGNGDGETDPCNVDDAVHSAASYLGSLGAPEDYRGALCSYYGACADSNANYADEVLAQAEQYRKAAGESGEDGGGGQEDDDNSTPAIIPPLFSTAHADPASDDSGGSPEEGSGKPPQGWDLVDPDRDIHYELDTEYAAEFEEAAEEWNALGGVDIEPSPSPQETDVVVKDGLLEGAAGAQTSSEGSITYNTGTFGEITESAQLTASIHEIGHALGFAHNEKEGSVMNHAVVGNSDATATSLSDYDVDLYEQTWGSGSEDDADETDEGSGSEDAADETDEGSGEDGSTEDESTEQGSAPIAPAPASAEMPDYCTPFRIAGLIQDVGEGVSGLAASGGFGSEASASEGSGSSEGSGKIGGGPEKGKELVEAAKQYMGVPYVIGSLEPSVCNPQSIDCDCIIYLALQDIGAPTDHLNGDPQQYLELGEPVEGPPQAGDIIVYDQSGILSDVPGGHVAIATGNGNEIVHAIPPEATISPDYNSGQGPVSGVRRIF